MNFSQKPSKLGEPPTQTQGITDGQPLAVECVKSDVKEIQIFAGRKKSHQVRDEFMSGGVETYNMVRSDEDRNWADK